MLFGSRESKAATVSICVPEGEIETPQRFQAPGIESPEIMDTLLSEKVNLHLVSTKCCSFYDGIGPV